ncbi:histidine kinase [Actinoplanes sp. NEAU-A12]|uniref:histidine kinase n=1 Tax=Actinoplanes sandaracinus TaxID=3045177 RepID=A0ABT6WMW2_9ACTN|nr:histidine kinase [Actinoplanes sandaracinus]MDI6101078.1 histidine kinase [Actinoplanes sandaracinus]
MTGASETAVATARKRWALSPGRAWDITAILVSWFGGLVLVGEAQSVRNLSDNDVFLLFVAGCLFSLALWWRRSRPVPVAVLLLIGSLITDAAGLAALIALSTVVAVRRGRVIVVLTLLHAVTAITYAVIYADEAVPHLVSLLLTVAILATTIALGVAARARQELIDSLRERTVRAEEEARLRADRLRALERERIAREMHDSLAHRISMVSLHAGALQIRPDLTPDEVAKAATTIRDSAHQALEDLREILGVLRAGEGEALRPQPDLRHLDELVADAREAGVPVTVTDRLDGLPAGASLGRTVYRLVQEGLTNAGKHAAGVPVSLVLDRTADGEVHVLVSNPLRVSARTAVPGAGSGLVGLAERVDLIDGRLRHGVRGDPRTGLTFDLEAWLPWPANADAAACEVAAG